MRRVLIVLVLSGVWLAPAWAQQVDNYELRALPAPGEVTIDGNLDDWDLSAGIFMCFDVGTLAETNSAWAYMMYDDQYLYLAFRFKDRTPLVNHLDPKNEPGEGWRSDAVQTRMQTDQVLHVDTWYWTDAQQPAMQINYVDMGLPPEQRKGRFLADALAEGAQAAFSLTEDGQGYVQEMALPWQLIRQEGQPYRAGETFRTGFECMWGDLTGRGSLPAHRLVDLINPKMPRRSFFWSSKEAWGTVVLLAENDVEPSPSASMAVSSLGDDDKLSLTERLSMKQTATSGPVELSYELPDNAYVTLVLEDEQGRRVRNLIADAFRPAGANVDYWDGADDEGHLVSPGRYQFRGLHYQDLDAIYQFTFGSPGNPPWETVDGRGAWLADHSTCQALAADDERIYLAAPNAESGNAVIAVDYSGQKLWGIARVRFWGDSGAALAVDDDHLYIAVDALKQIGVTPYGEVNKIILYRVDKRTGAYAPFAEGQAYHTIAEYDRDLYCAPRSEGDWIASGDHSPEYSRCDLMGMACREGQLYVSCYLTNRILVLDAEQGEVIKEISLSRPAGITVDNQGRLLAISGRKVVVVNPRSGATAPLIVGVGGGLRAPMSLTTDAQGNIYVGDWAREMCVKVFSPIGEPLRVVGKRGGRPWIGAWSREGMLLPRGLTVDAQQRLWVAEDDLYPKRVSIWNARGAFERELIGPPFYNEYGTNVNAFDPTRALLNGGELKLDWRTGQWQARGTAWRPTHPLALFGPNPRQHGSYRNIKVDGREFIVSSSRWVVISEWQGDRYQPLAALGHVGAFVHRYQGQVKHLAHGDQRLAVPILDEHRTPPEHRDKIKHPELWEWYPEETTNFCWSDRNGDALVQTDEIIFFEAPGTGPIRWDFLWANPVGEDLSIYPYNVVGGRELIWRVPRVGWTECGAPLYEPEQATLMVNRARKSAPGRNSSASWVFSEGEVLSTEAPLTLFDERGDPLWTYPNDWPGMGSHQAPASRPGLFIGPLFTLGEADLGGEIGRIFAIRANYGEDFIFTLDGLYIGNLFRDTRAAPEAFPAQAQPGLSLKNVSASGEPFGGTLWQNPDSGKVYVTVGSSAPSICEIRGLETIRRLSAESVEFTQVRYAQAEQLLAKKATEEQPPVFTLYRAPRRPEIDGQLNEWSSRSAASIYLDSYHQAEAFATYDDQNLYLAYRVNDKMELANGGQDWTILFKTGSAVEFEIGVDPQANPQRGQPVQGDKRLLIAPFQGELIAVLYDFVVPGAQEPTPFSSAVGTVVVDVVRKIETAVLAVTKGAGFYIVEAAIPLSELGLSPQPGTRLRGDFGVVWSDPTGRLNAARCYWANEAAGIVSDLPSETRLNPAMWGEIEIAE